MTSRRTAALVLAGMLALALGCSGDGDGVTTVGFAPAARTPSPGQVALAVTQSVGQTLALAVRVREVAGIRRADLTIVYDPVRLVFLGTEEGTLLEGTDGAAAYQGGEEIPGRLRVLAVRTGPGTVDATAAEEPVVLLIFSAVTTGTSTLTFSPASRLDGADDAPIEGITFHGGTVTAF